MVECTEDAEVDPCGRKANIHFPSLCLFYASKRKEKSNANGVRNSDWRFWGGSNYHRADHRRIAPGNSVYQGDRIGLPSEEILAGNGPMDEPGGPLQRGFALHWLGVIAEDLKAGKAVLLDAQLRIGKYPLA